ncbi:MAG TPA: Uma2 family endonuclease, partial [Candidatus Competibacteraceae bacterium]|nr:Uma2 family endonuclease [Candidatus Competibacteraceae bacterium]
DVAQSGVLPGFQWRLRDLERRPPLQALIDDPVYAGYVLRSLQQERQAKEQERQARLAAEQRVAQEQQARLVAEQRAEQEQQARLVAEQRAEQEQHAAQQEVERLRALLRQAGMEP